MSGIVLWLYRQVISHTFHRLINEEQLYIAGFRKQQNLYAKPKILAATRTSLWLVYLIHIYLTTQ